MEIQLMTHPRASFHQAEPSFDRAVIGVQAETSIDELVRELTNQ